MKKVLKFLRELTNISEIEKENFLKRYDGEKDERELGETLLLLIERHENFKKPELLAKILKAHIRSFLTSEEFHILATSIDRALIQDIELLVELIQKEYDYRKREDYYKLYQLSQQKQDVAKNLYNAGLSSIDLEIERGKSLGQAMAERGMGGSHSEPGLIKQIGVTFTLKPEAELLARAILDLWE